MKNIVTERLATNSLLTIISLVIVFHLLIMAGITPFEIVWGGRLKDSSEMISFEIVSVIINMIMLVTVGINAGFLKVKANRIVIKIALWSMFVLFLVNTIGNLFSNNTFEKVVFMPLTILLSVFSLRLATGKKQERAD